MRGEFGDFDADVGHAPFEFVAVSLAFSGLFEVNDARVPGGQLDAFVAEVGHVAGNGIKGIKWFGVAQKLSEKDAGAFHCFHALAGNRVKVLVNKLLYFQKEIRAMQNEGRIVELLAEMLIKQDIFIAELRNVKNELVGVNQRLDEHSEILKEHSEILKEHSGILIRHERLLERNDHQTQRILELLSEDVIRFDEVLDVEQLEEGKRIVLHKSKYASNL